MRLRMLFLAMLLAQVLYPCSGQVSMDVPAVVGDNGNLVQASIRLVPGSGNVFISVEPRVGTDTQTSLQDAMLFAKSEAGIYADECDILIMFDKSEVNGYIEGPSAGVAMAVMGYALLGNHTIRDDTVITGSVDSEGRIGSVGGLHEKAKAAWEDGAEYFIAPPMGFYEMLVLRELEEDYDITVIEAMDAGDVIRFMLFGEEINQSGFRAAIMEAPDVPGYDYSGIEDFVPVSEDMLRLVNRTLSGLNGGGEEAVEMKRFFEGKLAVNSALLQKGYLFTAANAAFLDYIEISTIKAITEDNLDLEAKRSHVESCFGSIERPAMTDTNYQWIIGSQLREAWAMETLGRTSLEEAVLSEEMFILYHELMYADAWCEVSKSLTSAAGEDGTAFDERIWLEMADEMLLAADEGEHGPDTTKRLGIAKESYRRGNYGAAIFDAVFVMEMDAADADLQAMSDEDLETEMAALKTQERTSLWGQVYHSQGVFLAEEGSMDSAYRILRLAEGLDTAAAFMHAEIDLVRADEQEEGMQETFFMVVRLLLFLIFLAMLAYITVHRDRKRRLHGRDKNKGRRGASGADQKKGRA